MKFDKKLQKISEKSQMRRDRVVIILGLSLLVASCFSYFVIEAFGQQDLQLDCPKNAYHGLDNQGNKACRDILTNQILEPESVIIIDSYSEKTNPDSWIINDSETGKIILNDEQSPIVEIIILGLIGIVGSIIGISAKKGKLKTFQRQGWNSTQKEQVRNRQYDRCNMCFTQPSQWKYDYTDGNKSNKDLNNCQGLCSHCYSVKTERNNQVSIYQKLN